MLSRLHIEETDQNRCSVVPSLWLYVYDYVKMVMQKVEVDEDVREIEEDVQVLCWWARGIIKIRAEMISCPLQFSEEMADNGSSSHTCNHRRI